jgi:hypothetical protein
MSTSTVMRRFATPMMGTEHCHEAVVHTHEHAHNDGHHQHEHQCCH